MRLRFLIYQDTNNFHLERSNLTLKRWNDFISTYLFLIPELKLDLNIFTAIIMIINKIKQADEFQAVFLNLDFET